MIDQKEIHSKLLDIRDSEKVLNEVKSIVSLISPRFDFLYLDKVFSDIEKLFKGQYDGFRACNTNYHDIKHTMMVFLAMARLIHGAHVQGEKFTDKEINVGLISALMHDTGYIQSLDDQTGTGAKYTLIHIKRSIIFCQNYFASEEYFQEHINDFHDILNCTGYNMVIKKIKFSSPQIEMLGKMLGTADLLGQMADRLYLEKLIHLYHEFDEAKIPGFDGELDLFRKTVNFYNKTKERFKNNLGGAHLFMISHFRNRWNIEKNIYEEAIENNINYLKSILKSNQKTIHTSLRRNTITIQ
jgi:hypothetical protein